MIAVWILLLICPIRELALLGAHIGTSSRHGAGSTMLDVADNDCIHQDGGDCARTARKMWCNNA